MAAVSHETLAPEAGAKRKYRSPSRLRRREATRQALIDSVLALAARGIFRASAAEIAQAAGVDRRAITTHFGAVELLYRVVARERGASAAVLLPFRPADPADRDRAVWAVLVGRPRGLS